MIEIIPKKPTREIPFKNIPFFIAGVLLLTAVLGYVIIVRMESRALIALGDLEDGIVRVGTREDRIMEANVFAAEKRINDFAVLLGSRRKPSNFFENFAGLIHPKVWFSSVELNVVQLQAAVSGKSPNFGTLEQQLIFLKSQEDFVESFDLSKITIGEKGEAEFNINFNFKPEIFN